MWWIASWLIAFERSILSCPAAESSLRWAFSHLGIGGTNIEAVSECLGLAPDLFPPKKGGGFPDVSSNDKIKRSGIYIFIYK